MCAKAFFMPNSGKKPFARSRNRPATAGAGLAGVRIAALPQVYNQIPQALRHALSGSARWPGVP